MSQAQWDRSTIGGAAPGASRRRLVVTAAAGLAVGFAGGTFLAMKYEIPQMLKAGGGNIVVATVSGTEVYAGAVAASHPAGTELPGQSTAPMPPPGDTH